MKNKITKIPAHELKPGHVIDPPAGERVWLWRDGVKRRYTVTGIEPGKVTKKGSFVKVNATVPSPYGNEKPIEIDCQLLEDKLVPLRGGEPEPALDIETSREAEEAERAPEPDLTPAEIAERDRKALDAAGPLEDALPLPPAPRKPKIRAIFVDENDEPVDPEENLDEAIADLEALLGALKETRDAPPAEPAKPTKPASKVRKGDRIFDVDRDGTRRIVTVVRTGKGYGDNERRITFNPYGLDADAIFEQSLTCDRDFLIEIAPD